jgi:hypothetical protein
MTHVHFLVNLIKHNCVFNGKIQLHSEVEVSLRVFCSNMDMLYPSKCQLIRHITALLSLSTPVKAKVLAVM